MSNNSFGRGIDVIYADQNKVIKNALNLTAFMFGLMSIVAMVAGSFMSSLTPTTMTFLMIVAVVLQIALIFATNKNQFNEKAIAFCLVFAFIEGIIIPIICLSLGVTAEQVFVAILITAAITMATGYIGYSSNSMSSMGKYLFIAIVALIIASVAQFFIKSSMLYFAITWIGAVIFALYIMYDVNQMRHNPNLTYPVVAMNLFIDITGLFTFVLRLVGGSSSDD